MNNSRYPEDPPRQPNYTRTRIVRDLPPVIQWLRISDNCKIQIYSKKLQYIYNVGNLYGKTPAFKFKMSVLSPTRTRIMFSW